LRIFRLSGADYQLYNDRANGNCKNKSVNLYYYMAVFCLLAGAAAGGAQSGGAGSFPGFFAYHTRLDYTIALHEAAKAMPGYLEVMKRQGKGLEDLADVKVKTLTGPHADLVVNLGKSGRFIFSRESGYRPYWENERGRWLVDELVPRQEDVACLYTYVRLIEDEPGFVLVHWRYLPDVSSPDGLGGAVHELRFQGEHPLAGRVPGALVIVAEEMVAGAGGEPADGERFFRVGHDLSSHARFATRVAGRVRGKCAKSGQNPTFLVNNVAFVSTNDKHAEGTKSRLVPDGQGQASDGTGIAHR
jgi:hypothetical protein